MSWDPFGTQAKKDIDRAAQQQAAAAQAAAKAQAKAFRFNAQVYARNADVVEQQALLDEAKQRAAARRFTGQQESAIAGSGFQDVGFDGIREDTADSLDLDAIIIRRQGQFRAADYIAQEQLAYMNADTAIKSGQAAAQAAILEGNLRGNAAQSSAISGTIGTAVSVAGIFMSDSRIKENVDRVGTTPNGLGVFTFNYIWDEPDARRVGVMAQEVRERYPDAVSKSPEGILAVDYSKIGLPDGYTLTAALTGTAKSSRVGRKAVFESFRKHDGPK